MYIREDPAYPFFISNGDYPMKLELKNIKVLASLSEETPAYTATLYADGKKVCDVSNHGHGGPDDCHGGKDAYAAYEVVDKWVEANHPSETFECNGTTHELKASLEAWCHGEVYAAQDKKNFASKLSRSVMYVRPNEKNVFGATFPKGKDKAAVLAAYKAKYPTYTFLNGMPADEAFKLYTANVAVR